MTNNFQVELFDPKELGWGNNPRWHDNKDVKLFRYKIILDKNTTPKVRQFEIDGLLLQNIESKFPNDPNALEEAVRKAVISEITREIESVQSISELEHFKIYQYNKKKHTNL